MAGLDDLYQQIPTSEIAAKLGADEGEVDKAVQTLVPVLLSGLQHNSQDPEHASEIESAASGHAARGLLDAGGGSTRLTSTTGIRPSRHCSAARTPTKSPPRWPMAAQATAICSNSCYPSCCQLCWPTSENNSDRVAARRIPAHRSRRTPAAGWATSSAAFWVVAATTSRLAEFWAVCWAARAAGSATSLAACLAARNSQRHNKIALSATLPGPARGSRLRIRGTTNGGRLQSAGTGQREGWRGKVMSDTLTEGQKLVRGSRWSQRTGPIA